VLNDHSVHKDISLQHGLLNSLSPWLRPTAQKKSTSFKIGLLIQNVPGYRRALMGMDNMTGAVLKPVNTHSAAQEPGVFLLCLTVYEMYL